MRRYFGHRVLRCISLSNISTGCIAFIGVALFALLHARGVEAAVGIEPYFEKDAIPRQVVGLRYSMRIDHLKADSNIVILFGHIRLWNHAQPQKTHMLEVNNYSYWVEYQDTGSAPWPPGNNGKTHNTEGGLWVSVSDYNKEGFVGIRQRDEGSRKMFPRINTGIDNIPGLTKIETICQQNMLGKDVYVEVTKGDELKVEEAQDNWGGRYLLENGKQVSLEKLPAGEYQLWKARAVFNGKEFGWEAAYPADQARYIAPHQIIHFVTEFFEMKTKTRMYVWNPQYLREGQKEWEGITRWRRHYQAGDDPYGPRIAEFNGRHVLEFSNDKAPDAYPKKGDIIGLKMNPTIQWKTSRSAATAGQRSVQVEAEIDKPMKEAVTLQVRCGGTAVRGADYMLDETTAITIPAGETNASVDIPLLANPSRKKGARIRLTFVSGERFATAGRVSHVVTLSAR